MATAVVESIQTIGDMEEGGEQQAPLDLHRVEIINMPHSSYAPPAEETKEQDLNPTACIPVKGLVLDHGSRHPNMPTLVKNCHIMTCNVSLEYEKTEVQSGFFYSNADEREKLVESERKWLDERCRLIVDFKRKVCKEGQSFVMINQKGIDPLSLDMFAKEGILCLRRAKRRNMERLTLACGGSPIHSLEDMEESMLGYAGKVSEVSFGDDKFTFVEDCRHPKSCTLLLQGPNSLVMDQMKDAVRDGLRAVKNAIEDAAVVPGGGAFELAASMHLKSKVLPATKGKAKLGVEAFAEALMVIPKTLAENSGFDVQETILKMEEERAASELPVGLNCTTGEPMLPADEGVWDNVRVKRQSLYLATVLASQLLLVDEVMRAGKQMGKPQGNPSDM
jgi:T-complex protein 1 subunit zeta